MRCCKKRQGSQAMIHMQAVTTPRAPPGYPQSLVNQLRTWERDPDVNINITSPVHAPGHRVHGFDGVLRGACYHRNSRFAYTPVPRFECHQVWCIMTSQFRPDDLACAHQHQTKAGSLLLHFVHRVVYVLCIRHSAAPAFSSRSLIEAWLGVGIPEFP